MKQQLQVQELCVSTKEPQLYVVSGSDLIVFIDEAIQEVKAILNVDDSGPTSLPIAASARSIVDSTAFTAGGDRKAIKLTGLGSSFAVNDLLIIKYIVQQ